MHDFERRDSQVLQDNPGKNRSFLAKFDGCRGPNEYHERRDGRETSRFRFYSAKNPTARTCFGAREV